MSFEPARRRITIHRGSTFARGWQLLHGQFTDSPPRDLTGCEASFDIFPGRRTATSPQVSATTATGGVVLDADAGLIVVVIPHTATNFEWSVGTYELWLYSPTDHKDLLLYGTLRIKP